MSAPTTNGMFEAFLLYYTAFHEFEITAKELKEMLVAEIGEEGFKEALVVFKEEREKLVAAGDKRTYYEAKVKTECPKT